jgi:hypothetical protein
VSIHPSVFVVCRLHSLLPVLTAVRRLKRSPPFGSFPMAKNETNTTYQEGGKA